MFPGQSNVTLSGETTESEKKDFSQLGLNSDHCYGVYTPLKLWSKNQKSQ